MRIPPPPFLPKLNSPRWHGMRGRTPIGYLRVQPLSRDRADADLRWILHMLKSDQDMDSRAADRAPVLDARDLLVKMTKTRRRAGESDDSFNRRLDAYWTDAIALIDSYLTIEHDEHIAAVRTAGASGI